MIRKLAKLNSEPFLYWATMAVIMIASQYTVYSAAVMFSFTIMPFIVEQAKSHLLHAPVITRCSEVSDGNAITKFFEDIYRNKSQNEISQKFYVFLSLFNIVFPTISIPAVMALAFFQNREHINVTESLYQKTKNLEVPRTYLSAITNVTHKFYNLGMGGALNSKKLPFAPSMQGTQMLFPALINNGNDPFTLTNGARYQV